MKRYAALTGIVLGALIIGTWYSLEPPTSTKQALDQAALSRSTYATPPVISNVPQDVIQTIEQAAAQQIPTKAPVGSLTYATLTSYTGTTAEGTLTYQQAGVAPAQFDAQLAYGTWHITKYKYL